MANTTSSSRGGILKVIIWVAFLMSLASSVSAASLYFLLTAATEEAKHSEASKIQLQDQVSSLRNELGGMQSEMKAVRQEGLSYRDKTDDLMQQIQDARSSANDYKVKLSASEDKIQTLENSIDALKKELVSKVKEVAEYDTSGTSVFRSVAAPVSRTITAPVRMLIPDSKDKVKRFPSSASEPVSEKQAKPMEKASESMASPTTSASSVGGYAAIKTVNRKFNFAIVNLSSGEKFSVGDKLRVERDGKKVGELQVQKMYERFASAKILKEAQAGSIQEGDRVRKG